MKKQKVVLLNKDHSVKVAKHESDILNSTCKYALIPVTDYSTNTFIMIKPKKTLEFTVGYIEYTLQFKNVFEYDTGDVVKLKPVKIEVRTIIDLINALHSLDRIDYVNYVLNKNNFTDVINILDINELSVKLCNGANVVYEHMYISNPETDSFLKANCYEVVRDLHEVYQPKNKDLQFPKANGYLNINNNMWSIDKSPKIDSIVGMNLAITQSVYFTDIEEYDLFNHFHKFRCDGSIFNRDEINPLELHDSDIPSAIEAGDIEVYSDFMLDAREPENIIEFILYLNVVYTIILMLYNLIIFELDKDNTAKKGFDVYLDISISSQYNKEVHFDIIEKRIPTIEFIKKILYSGWSE